MHRLHPLPPLWLLQSCPHPPLDAPALHIYRVRLNVCVDAIWLDVNVYRMVLGLTSDIFAGLGSVDPEPDA